MDQDRINQYNEKLKAEAEKREHQRELEQTINATKNSANSIIKAVVVESQKNRQSVQKVKSVDPLASPEDIRKVVEGLDEILVSQTITTDDLTEKFKDISAGLLVLADEISALPKELPKFPDFPEQKEEIKVTNLAELSEYFVNVVTAVNSLKESFVFDPTIEVAPADVKVEATDLKPILDGLSKLEKAITDIEFPEYDNSQLLDATQNVTNAINGLEFPVPNYVIPFKDAHGKGTQVTLGNSGGLGVQAADSPSIDAFARWRVSNPETIFDSKQIFDSQPLFWDDQEVSGGGTSSSHSADTASTTIGVSLNTAGRRVRQTFRRLNYQPGKSQLVLLTGTLGSTGGGTGITRSAGIYDDNNGIFFKDDEGVLKAVIRSNATGTPVDTEVAQSDWNLDKLDGTGSSGITLDPTKSQIIIIDYEWLGVGRVRVGFVFDGIPVYCHQFVQANNNAGVYMSTPNLPLRYEIENDGTGAASTLEHICASVVSEGGAQDNGLVRYSSTANTQVDCAVVGTIYGIKGIRLKSTALDGTVKLLNASLQVQSASDDLEYVLIFNPTVAGTPTWNDEANSTVQTATGATANTITNGTYITGGYIASGNAQNASGIIAQEIPNSLLLGSGIDGTPDEIWLCARPLTNVNTLVEGSITWRELS